MLRIFVILFSLAAFPAAAAQICQRHDTTLKPLPSRWVAEAQKAFGLTQAPKDWVQQTTVIRCKDGNIWACNVGANLPCGRADTAANLPAGAKWCRQNPDSDFIPASITGHDSIWNWRCTAGLPATTGPPAVVDGQGYFSVYWKRLD